MVESKESIETVESLDQYGKYRFLYSPLRPLESDSLLTLDFIKFQSFKKEKHSKSKPSNDSPAPSLREVKKVFKPKKPHSALASKRESTDAHPTASAVFEDVEFENDYSKLILSASRSYKIFNEPEEEKTPSEVQFLLKPKATKEQTHTEIIRDEAYKEKLGALKESRVHTEIVREESGSIQSDFADSVDIDLQLEPLDVDEPEDIVDEEESFFLLETDSFSDAPESIPSAESQSGSSIKLKAKKSAGTQAGVTPVRAAKSVEGKPKSTTVLRGTKSAEAKTKYVKPVESKTKKTVKEQKTKEPEAVEVKVIDKPKDSVAAKRSPKETEPEAVEVKVIHKPKDSTAAKPKAKKPAVSKPSSEELETESFKEPTTESSDYHDADASMDDLISLNSEELLEMEPTDSDHSRTLLRKTFKDNQRYDDEEELLEKHVISIHPSEKDFEVVKRKSTQPNFGVRLFIEDDQEIEHILVDSAPFRIVKESNRFLLISPREEERPLTSQVIIKEARASDHIGTMQQTASTLSIISGRVNIRESEESVFDNIFETKQCRCGCNDWVAVPHHGHVDSNRKGQRLLTDADFSDSVIQLQRKYHSATCICGCDQEVSLVNLVQTQNANIARTCLFKLKSLNVAMKRKFGFGRNDDPCC